MLSPIVATVLVALSLLVAGCGGGGPTSAEADANPSFSTEELAAMRKSVRTYADYQHLLRIKTMEREGTAKVVYPSDKRKATRRN